MKKAAVKVIKKPKTTNKVTKKIKPQRVQTAESWKREMMKKKKALK